MTQDDIYIATLWAEAVKRQAEADDAQRESDRAAARARGAKWHAAQAEGLARAAEDRRRQGERVIPTEEEHGAMVANAARAALEAENADVTAHPPSPIVGVDLRARMAVGASAVPGRGATACK